MSSKLQKIVDTFESLLTNQTLWRTEGRQEISSTATTILQDVESKVLENALKAPEQKVQKIQNSSVGKTIMRPDTHWGLVSSWDLG